jgi:glucose-1-phosphate cytidylyltransferase
MKAVILAGGRGTRLSEETHLKPKPLVEAHGKPLIWHIMKNYSMHGVSEFIVLAGYKGHMLKEYFANFWLNDADVTFDLSEPKLDVHSKRGEPWKVTVIDSGLDTMTGGRLSYLQNLITETFLLTYGDGVSNVDITKLISFHKSSPSLATLTAVQPPARFGALDLSENFVNGFEEKPVGDGGWVNGGFFVLEPEILKYVKSEKDSFESDVLPDIAKSGQLKAFKHDGFWQPVDTVRDLERLNLALGAGELTW